MYYIAFNLEAFKGQSIGSGQCVAFVQEAAKAPRTDHWFQGQKVFGSNIQKGTAIATFYAGRYKNNTNGESHAAIFLRQTTEGIYVLDQWNHHGHRQPVHERL